MIQGYPHFRKPPYQYITTLEFPVPAGEPLPDLDSTRPARESRPGHPWPKCPRKTHRSTWKFSDVMERTSVTPHKKWHFCMGETMMKAMNTETLGVPQFFGRSQTGDLASLVYRSSGEFGHVPNIGVSNWSSWPWNPIKSHEIIWNHIKSPLKPIKFH